MLVRASVLESQRALVAAAGGGPFLGRHADLRACRLNCLFIGTSPTGGPSGSRLWHTLLKCVSQGRSRACVPPSTRVDHHRAKPRRQSSHVASSVRSGILRTGRSCGCFAGDPRNGSRSDAGSAVPDGIDRQRRFDRREGHDLERLLWPGTGSGDSTGLLQNFSVNGRRSPTVEPIKSAPSLVVKQGRSSDLHRQVDRATPTVRRPTITASRTHCPRRKTAPPQMRWGLNDSVRLPWILRMLRGPAFWPRPCRGPVRGPIRAGAPGAR